MITHRNVAKDHKLQALRSLPLFARLSDPDLVQLGRVTDRVFVRTGRDLTTQGRVETHMSIIVSGAASVSIDGEQVAVLGPGAYVGEIAMVDAQPATATVTTIEPTVVWYVSRAGFVPIWERNPELSTVLLREVSAKLRSTDELVAGRSAEPAPVAELVDHRSRV